MVDTEVLNGMMLILNIVTNVLLIAVLLDTLIDSCRERKKHEKGKSNP